MIAATAPDSRSNPHAASSFFASLEKRVVVLALVLVGLTLALYNQANHFAFINYDDNHYVYDNPHVRSGLTWNTLKWALTSLEQANWHPLTWISHALDCQLFQLNPAGHHFTSVVLHALNAGLLFLLLARATSRTGPSFVVSALFALHPMNVESVAWIAERKNLLCTTFFLLTLAAYGWHAAKPAWRRLLAVAGLLACGLAAKPMLVTTPFVLLLVDYWPLCRIQGWRCPCQTLRIPQQSLSRLIVEKLPMLALSVASCIITLVAQRAGGAVGTVPFPFAARFENALWAYTAYIGKTIWPAHLTLFYPYSGRSLPGWKAALAALFLIVITALVLKARSRPYLLMGWLWFLGTLVPVIGVIQVGNQAMADRYAYLPLIGMFVIFVWAIADWLQAKHWPGALPTIAAVIALAALSIATSRQIGYWRDSVTVWTHALRVTEHNFVAEDNLGVALTQLNRVDEAYPLFVRAAQDEPNDPVARLNIGAYLHQHGREAEAIPQYQMALKLGAEPDLRATTYANLGSAFSDLGDDQDAKVSFEQALRISPSQAGAWQGLAYVLERQGDHEGAIQCYAHLVEIEPSASGYLELARVLAQAGHRDQAIAAYEAARKLAPALRPLQPAAASTFAGSHRSP